MLTELDEDGNPVLTDTNHVRWIDRLANLPDWAIHMYDWMAENSDGDEVEDALINPTTGQAYDMDGKEVYVYHVATTPEQTLEFVFPQIRRHI